jgi:hypothetical protein
MSETFLNGKITVSSLAAPTPEDLVKLCALSKDERIALLSEAIERGNSSRISTKSVDEIWDSALRNAKKLQENSEHAL